MLESFKGTLYFCHALGADSSHLGECTCLRVFLLVLCHLAMYSSFNQANIIQAMRNLLKLIVSKRLLIKFKQNV